MSTKIALIGAGSMARHHLPLMIEKGAEILVICEPSSNNYEQTVAKLDELKVPPAPKRTPPCPIAGTVQRRT